MSSPPLPSPPRRDFTLDIELVGPGTTPTLTPRVWRRLTVSGGIQLPTLVDKLLTPAMVRRLGRRLHTWAGAGAA